MALTGLAILPCLGAPIAAFAADDPPTGKNAADVTAGYDPTSPRKTESFLDMLQRIGKSLGEVEKKAARERKFGEVQARIGSASSTFALGSGRIEPRHQFSPRADGMSSNLGIVLDGNLMSTTVEGTRTDATGWTSTQGVTGAVHQRFELAMHHDITSGNSRGQLTRDASRTLEAREEAYRTWSRERSESDTVTLGISGGASQDLMHGVPQVFVGAVQAVQRELAPRPVLGSHASVTLHASEGLHRYTRVAVTEPSYEMEAAIAMRYPTRHLGPISEVGVAMGTKVAGMPGNKAQILPDVGVTLQF